MPNFDSNTGSGGAPISAAGSAERPHLGEADVARRVDEVGMKDVAEQLDPVDQPRAGREKLDAASTAKTAPGAEAGDPLPVLDRLRAGALDVPAAGHRDHDVGLEGGERPPATSGDFSPGGPATSSPPAIEIISGIQWPPTKGGSSHSSAITRRGWRR